ncbi:MAG TPA: ComF family protein [Verrucomicrobiae bacterium]|nr:ComF family protein [Verrucomicrobiae bacterium]
MAIHTRLNFFTRLLGLVFPHVCEFCGEREATPSDSFICQHCRAHPRAIRPVRPPFCKVCGLWYEGQITLDFTCRNCFDLELEFASARAAVQYYGLVKQVIHRFKYNRKEWFEPFLAELLIESAAPDLKCEPVDLIVPIPLHPRKQRGRGFNQAERLATRLSVATGIPTRADLMQRVRDTDPQAHLDLDDRVANVKNAFAYVPTEKLNKQRVLLVDDVLTTGLTASSCAKELLKNGASEVRVWTVARGGLS